MKCTLPIQECQNFPTGSQKEIINTERRNRKNMQQFKNNVPDLGREQLLIAWQIQQR